MVEIIKKSFADVPQFSARDKAYTLGDEQLKPFYKYPVKIESFARAIADRKRFPVDRELLVSTLRNQYANYQNTGTESEKQIGKLGLENTFTVITAHQPVLFTGPLYFIYKIASAINLSQQLNSFYPDYHFIPVFISGGEDHDFEEMNHVNIFNRNLEWQNEEKGPVGKMNTDSLTEVIEELKEMLGEGHHAGKLRELINRNFKSGNSYGPSMLSFVNELFEEYGLLVLNMDDPGLKKAFAPIIKREIFERISQPLVSESQERLKSLGFKAQAHAREINFFYMEKGLRERIVFKNGQYSVLNTKLVFSREELEKRIDECPENFSPNVIMRPVFQETIVPNLAYIGGGGELAYWLERMSQFEAFGTFFPMLIRRNSALWITKAFFKKIEKLELSIDQFFDENDQIVKDYVKQNSSEDLDFNRQLKDLRDGFTSIINTGSAVDPTLGKAFEALKKRHMKEIEQMIGRILRAKKQKHELEIKQIGKLKDKLFPKNGLQERVDNFIPMYLNHGKQLFEILLENLNPLDSEMLIMVEN